MQLLQIGALQSMQLSRVSSCEHFLANVFILAMASGSYSTVGFDLWLPSRRSDDRARTDSKQSIIVINLRRALLSDDDARLIADGDEAIYFVISEQVF
jgi:hypothetical protein